MSRSERLTAPAANAASVLEHELRRLFQRDGVIDMEERRALKLAVALTKETNRVDAALGVIASGLCVDGVAAPNFKRKLREFERDWDPDPTSPTHAKAA